MRFGFDSDKKFRDIMYWGELFDVERAKEQGIVDEIVEEDRLIPRAKEVISSWIDNPGRAFTLLKTSLRKPYADRMRRRLRDEDWASGFNCMFDKGTRALLELGAKMQHPS